MKKVAAVVGILAVAVIGYAVWPESADDLSVDAEFDDGDRGTARSEETTRERESRGPSEEPDESDSSPAESSENSSEPVETEIEVVGVEEVDEGSGEGESRRDRSPKDDRANGSAPPDRTGGPNVPDELYQIEQDQDRLLPGPREESPGPPLRFDPRVMPMPEDSVPAESSE